MIITDPILKESGTQEKITQSLTERKINFFTFDDIPVVADSQTVDKALKLARDAHVHGIIAAGGAKTLNIAKAVASLYHEAHDLYSFIDGSRPTCAPLPLICVPTTIRDSFLFTDLAPIVDARSSKAKLIHTQNGLCRLALWDPNLEGTLTDKQQSSMNIEALCIATEAYLSQKSTFFSDMVVEKAVQILSYALDGSPTLTVTTPPEVLLAQGGCMASLGSASSSLGAASLLSLTINSRYKISRSLTSAILFPYIIEDGAKYRLDKLARLSRILRASQENSSDEEAVKALSEYVRERIAKANLPARLKDLGVTIERLSLAAEDAGELELLNTLSRSMTCDDLFDLIKQAY